MEVAVEVPQEHADFVVRAAADPQGVSAGGVDREVQEQAAGRNHPGER